MLGFDGVKQEDIIGEPFLIKCSWQEKSETRMSPESGEEFVSSRIYSTEDPRPKFGDQIRPVSDLVEVQDWQRIKTRDVYPMTAFGKREKPDFGLVT